MNGFCLYSDSADPSDIEALAHCTLHYFFDTVMPILQVCTLLKFMERQIVFNMSFIVKYIRDNPYITVTPLSEQMQRPPLLVTPCPFEV